MSEERHIVAQVEGNSPAFNGSTVVSVDPSKWREGLIGNTKYTYTQQGRIGRFTPASLGRQTRLHSVVRVYCDGPITTGDGITIRGSLSLSSDVAPVNPLRQALVPLTTSPSTAQALELGPTDDVCVVHTGDGTLATLHFVIYDLDEEAMAARDNARLLGAAVGGNTGADAVTTQTITANNATIDPWVGTKFVFVNIAAAGATIRLPDVATVPTPGPSGPINRLRIIRIGGNSVFVEAQNGQRLNEQLSPGYSFELEGFEEVEAIRVGSGYSVAKSLNAAAVSVANAVTDESQPCPAPTSHIHTVRLNYTANGNLVLPPLAEWPLGTVGILVRQNPGTAQVRIRPQAGEVLNSDTNGIAYLGGGGAGTAWPGFIRRTLYGYIVWSIGNCSESPYLASGLAAVNLAPWGAQELMVELTAAGVAQQVNLPSRLLVPRGAICTVMPSASGAKTVAAFAAQTITGAGAAPANSYAMTTLIGRRFIAAGTTDWIVL